MTANSLPLYELSSEFVVASLLREMDETFCLDTVTLLHNNKSDSSVFNWDRNMSLKEFMVGFHSRIDKISKLEMTEERKGHLLSKQAKLDSHDRNLVIGASVGAIFDKPWQSAYATTSELSLPQLPLHTLLRPGTTAETSPAGESDPVMGKGTFTYLPTQSMIIYSVPSQNRIDHILFESQLSISMHVLP